GGRVDGEQDGAFKAVAPGEDLGQLRERLLGAVFLVAADEDDVLALAGALEAVVDDPGVGGAGTGHTQQKHEGGHRMSEGVHGVTSRMGRKDGKSACSFAACLLAVSRSQD